MRFDIAALCRFAPYVALAMLSIFGAIDTPIMIALLAVLIATSRRGPCLPARKA